ncbi:MAG: hypothetical protein ACLQPD_25925 [Desulfomonilaceae bacterium]
MKLRIQKIADRGNLEKERIVLRAVADTDVGVFAIFQVNTDRGNITSDVKDAFWFPDQRVSAGDMVVMYTKQGRDKPKFDESGRKIHFFYWGKDQPRWNKNFVPVLLSIADWEAYTFDSETEAAFSVSVK